MADQSQPDRGERDLKQTGCAAVEAFRQGDGPEARPERDREGRKRDRRQGAPMRSRFASMASMRAPPGIWLRIAAMPPKESASPISPCGQASDAR